MRFAQAWLSGIRELCKIAAIASLDDGFVDNAVFCGMRSTQFKTPTGGGDPVGVGGNDQRPGGGGSLVYRNGAWEEEMRDPEFCSQADARG
jgi:hypothetical protein